MSKIFPPKIKYLLKVILPLVLLFQWTMPVVVYEKNIHINFSDITFDTCNDPDHSHPPLSQKNASENTDKFVSLDINSPIISIFHICFDITSEVVFEKPKISIELLFKYFSPARSPPFLAA